MGGERWSFYSTRREQTVRETLSVVPGEHPR
jgi:hypothetical protein